MPEIMPARTDIAHGVERLPQVDLFLPSWGEIRPMLRPGEPVPPADADAVATAIVRGSFEYQGQKCSAASRAYIPKSLWKRVREEMGLTNVKLMIPFCRTVDEGRKVVEVMRQSGLEQGKDGLEIYVMCEIPSNVVLAEDFAEIQGVISRELYEYEPGMDLESAPLLGTFRTDDPQSFIK